MSVFSSYFEDHSANKFFWHTGRSNIVGLRYADIYLKLSGQYLYTKIASLDYTAGTTTVINETFLVTLMNMDTSIGCGKSTKTSEIHIEVPIIDGVVDTENICCMSDNKSESGISGGSEDSVRVSLIRLSTNKIEVWVKTDKARIMLIRRSYSLSLDSVPENEHYPETYYTANFMETDVFQEDENNSKDELPTYGDIIKDNDNKSDFYGYISPSNFAYGCINYTALYEDNTPDDEYFITPIHVNTIEFSGSSEPIAKINEYDDSFSVTASGVYLLTFKHDFWLQEASSNAIVSTRVYKNSTHLGQLDASIYLEANKRLPFNTGITLLNLKPDDKIYLEANFDNVDGVSIYNKSMMQIVRLCKSETIVPIESDWYDPLVEVGRLGRTVLSLDENDIGTISYGNVDPNDVDNQNYVDYIKNGVSRTFE